MLKESINPTSMKEIQAPGTYPTRIFLAGSIEMGKAEDWQTRLVYDLSARKDIFILNPRRKDWDSSWKQDIGNRQFRRQVEWELAALEGADIIAMYFSPGTQSPISLLELGLFARTSKLVVCCPDGFWKKGNVDVVCQRFHIPQVATLKELTSYLRTFVSRRAA